MRQGDEIFQFGGVQTASLSAIPGSEKPGHSLYIPLSSLVYLYCGHTLLVFLSLSRFVPLLLIYLRLVHPSLPLFYKFLLSCLFTLLVQSLLTFENGNENRRLICFIAKCREAGGGGGGGGGGVQKLNLKL